MRKPTKQPAHTLNELKKRLKSNGLTDAQIEKYITLTLKNRPQEHKDIFEQCYGINSKKYTVQQVCNMHPGCDVPNIRQSVIKNIELEIIEMMSHENSGN